MVLTVGIATLVFARALAIHFEQISLAIEKVKRGDLNARASLATGDDLEWMAQSFNEMVGEISCASRTT